MKVAQLQVGKTYKNKKGVRRIIREMTGTTGHTPNQVYYLEEGDNFVRNIPKQEFAAWAKSEAAPMDNRFLPSRGK